MTYSTPAIILHRRDYGEWDRLYTAYTREHGKLTLIGKGTRRPKAKLAAHLEPYSEVDLVVARGRAIDRVTFARLIQSNASFSVSLEHVQCASFVVECVDRLTKEQHRDHALFDLLRDALRIVAECSIAPPFDGSTTPPPHHSTTHLTTAYITPFLLRLLSILGYTPQLDHCVECRTVLPPGACIGFPIRGGAACNRCAASMRNGIPLQDIEREQLIAASASFRPSPSPPAVSEFARVLLETHCVAPLRTPFPQTLLTREHATAMMPTS